MKSAVLAGPETIRVVEGNIPEPRPGWVRLAVQAVGICGTDLHLFEGRLGKVDGLQPGHEVAGVIDAVSDSDLTAGTLVALEPITACGRCFHCATGFPNRCETHRLFGVTARGGMAEFLTVPAACLHVLPDGVSPNVAALAEPMAVCVRGARLGRIGVGDRVAILGAGTIGLLSIVVARASGASEVHVAARHPHQAALARSLGSTEVFESAAALKDGAGPDIDVVVETVGGRADTLAEAVQVVRTGGTIAMLGVFEGDVRMPGLPFASKELTLVGSMCYARDGRVGDFDLATRLVLEHQGILAPLVTHRFKLDEVARAYATAADKRQGSVKVQIEP